MFGKWFQLKIVFSAILLFGLGFSFNALAQSIGSQAAFYVDTDYDYYGRTQVNAVLLHQSQKLNFYADSYWWDSLSFNMQNSIRADIYALANRFEFYDYPKIVSVFGSEANPGIDNDSRIYVLIHPLKENVLGYARYLDVLRSAGRNLSNQKEMVYLAASIFLEVPPEKWGYYLAHEVLHLISFNQKGFLVNAEDEYWLAEARSDYLSTFLGYDDKLFGSILEQRLTALRQNPSFSLFEFKGTQSDYAAVHLLAAYIVEKYGIKILADSFKSQLTGTASLNDALVRNGFSKNFNEVFKNWLIAMVLNDCSLGRLYCFENENLKDFRIYPYTNYFSDYGTVSLTSSAYLNLYAGIWLRIVGGRGKLKLYYEFPADAQFNFVYILSNNNHKKIETATEQNGNKGVITIDNWGKDYNSLYLLPIVTNNASGASLFKYDVRITGEAMANSALIEMLNQRIAQLKAQLAVLMAQLSAISSGSGNACSSFQRDLYYGLTNSWEVRCLQQMLSQKESDIYPESLITGNFLDLTKKAVQKYQEKYNLPSTGYFGPLTRQVANKQWFGY